MDPWALGKVFAAWDGDAVEMLPWGLVVVLGAGLVALWARLRRIVAAQEQAVARLQELAAAAQRAQDGVLVLANALAQGGQLSTQQLAAARHKLAEQRRLQDELRALVGDAPDAEALLERLVVPWEQRSH